MPKTTNAEASRKIKQIASMAGIITPATENGVTAPKWTFVRTHTARRSAATNLAMGGATLDFICKLGGWKKLETLEKYLLATRMEVARVVGGVGYRPPRVLMAAEPAQLFPAFIPQYGCPITGAR